MPVLRSNTATWELSTDGVLVEAIVNRTARLPVTASGHAYDPSPRSRSGFVRVVGSPPLAGTRCRPPLTSLVANTIVSSASHAAPRDPAATRHTIVGGPPVTGTFLITPPSKNPIHWPLGEKNTPRGVPNPETTDGSSWAIARTWIVPPLPM